MSYDITVHPQPLGVDVDVTDPVELAGKVTVDGIPSTYHINIDNIAKISLGVDPLTIEPLDVSVRLKEFPQSAAIFRQTLQSDFRFWDCNCSVFAYAVRLR